ncbi:MAG: hypothetical protein KDH94_03680 [Coxiellaceae bacterium]|nr:hypothetical protein [Coxiellaceae bacterium]
MKKLALIIATSMTVLLAGCDMMDMPTVSTDNDGGDSSIHQSYHQQGGDRGIHQGYHRDYSYRDNGDRYAPGPIVQGPVVHVSGGNGSGITQSHY